MGFFTSFQNELGRNSAKYLSNKIFGEVGWATPRRHIIAGEDTSSYTNLIPKDNSINTEKTSTEIPDREVRLKNSQYKQEYLKYLQSITTYHTIKSKNWVWTKGEEGTVFENDMVTAICDTFPKVFLPFSKQIDFKEIQNGFKNFFAVQMSFLEMELMGIKEIDKVSLTFENDYINRFSIVLNNFFSYHVGFSRNDRLWSKPESSDLDALLIDLTNYLQKKINSTGGIISRIFNSNRQSIDRVVENFVVDVRKYCEEFIFNCVELGNFQEKIISLSKDEALWWPLNKKLNSQEHAKKFFALVSELGHFDRFNEEGLCLKFNSSLSDSVWFDLFIDPKIKLPNNKVSTIYNDLKLKIEPLSNSEFNDILYKMISSLVVSLGIEIYAMKVERIKTVVIKVYLPGSKLEDQLCLKLKKEVGYFANPNLSKMDAANLFSLFSDSELTLNYSTRNGFLEIPN